jgi:hypothetical protein
MIEETVLPEKRDKEGIIEAIIDRFVLSKNFELDNEKTERRTERVKRSNYEGEIQVSSRENSSDEEKKKVTESLSPIDESPEETESNDSLENKQINNNEELEEDNKSDRRLKGTSP